MFERHQCVACRQHLQAQRRCQLAFVAGVARFAGAAEWSQHEGGFL